MQQELADLKKCSANEMEALRLENSRLRRKIEADPTQKNKKAEIPTPQPIEEEREYNLLPALPLPTTQHPFLPTATTIPAHCNHTLPTHNTTNPPTTHILPHHFTSTFPTIIRHPIPPHAHRRHQPFVDGITETPLPSQWEAFTIERYIGTLTSTSTSKYMSLISASTQVKMSFCARPFPPPSKDQPWNGSHPCLHTALTVSTPYPTYSSPSLS